ncbi:MAG: hypothetical protein KAT05_13730 [Spirochaetes bacterium]|nr:hypothetical protein [Spirochaetota bacterium]
MIEKYSDINIIHFYQKVLDKKSLKKYIPNFIVKIYQLFYDNTYSSAFDPKVLSNEPEIILQLIEATLKAEIDEVCKKIIPNTNNFIQITFEKDHAIPLVNMVTKNKDSNILLNVFFKRIVWDEINEFRKFFMLYIEHFLKKFHASYFPNNKAINKTVTKATYIVQELLQNANQHSYGNYDYELLIRFYDNKFHVTVINYAIREKAYQLLSIIDDIKSTKNLDRLLLKYLLEEKKHLGIITSIANYNIKKYDAKFINDEIMQVKFEIDI